MPFIKYESTRGTSYEQTHTKNPDELPIFLIPGILGNSSELNSLAEAINKQREGRTPIYIYEEPTCEGKPEDMPLGEHAASIAKEILEIRRNSPLPYILAGYSFGAILAAEVARVLQSVNRDPRLYVIDEPSKSCVQKYIEDDSGTMKTDLAMIVNYAATLSGMDTIAPTKETLSSLQKMELETRIDHLADSVLSQQQGIVSESSESSFYTFREIAKRNLRNLLQADIKPDQKLENVHLLFTEETTAKYDNSQTASEFNGGWDRHSTSITHLNAHAPTALAQQSHLDLLKEGNANSVATLMTQSLRKEITNEQLMEKHLQELLRGDMKEEKIRAIIDQLVSNRTSQKRSSVQFFNLFQPPKNQASEKSQNQSKELRTTELTPRIINIK